MGRTKNVESEYNYMEDLEIDPDDLHNEWINQPSLIMKYAKQVARAKEDMDDAHEKVKIVRSELIKKRKEGQGGTQQEIEAYYRMHPKHKKAKKVLSNCEYKFNILSAAVSAFHQRKSALENLVKLHGQQYFAGPAIPKSFDKEYVNSIKSKKAKSKIKKRLIAKRSKDG